MAEQRKVELAVISDVHLGTYGCHAKELLKYLKSIDPEVLVLNGDIIDIWQFSKRYWPKSHMKVVRYLLGMIAKGKTIYYITGNHDEVFRKFNHFSLGSFEIKNKLVLDLEGGPAWIFHGDVFDVVMKYSRWLAKLGAIGYDSLILVNSMINWVGKKMGKGPISMSRKIKNSVKSAVKFINDFEDTAAGIAIDNEFRYVVCGHIHQPEMREISNEKGNVLYLNSGDWIENLTSLEYHQGQWSIYSYLDDPGMKVYKEEDPDVDELVAMMDKKQLFAELQNELNIKL